MTQSNEVTVTQADREAAAEACFFGRSPETEREMREGFFDNDPIVQAFARHRIASTASNAAMVAELVEALEDAQATLSAVRATAASGGEAEGIERLFEALGGPDTLTPDEATAIMSAVYPKGGAA